MEKVLMEAIGFAGGTVTLFETKIRLKVKGFFHKIHIIEIPIKEISSIELNPSRLTGGYIKFTAAGLKGGIIGKNEVHFVGEREQQSFERIKEAIEQKMTKERFSTINIEDLERLAKLKDKGIITEDEFQKKKKEILGL